MNQIAFFLIHCILHLFGYWIPRAVRFVCAVICCCRPCVEYQRERYGYIYHPEREVRLLHNPSVTGCAVDVFGLMDVKASEREDRQFCVDPTVFTTDKAARAEKKRLLKEAEDKNMLSYDSPLYSGHVGTVMGALRPPKHVPYCREEMTGWDGGPVFIDWLYVDGEGPLPSYKHSKCPGFEDVLANNDNNNASEGQQHGIASDDGGVAVSMASPSHEPAFSSSEEGDGEHRAAATSPSTSSANAAEPFKSESKVKGVCFVLPGMSSESQSNYVQSFVRCMHANGYHCAVLNTRGMASNTPLTTTFLFNGGYTRDCRDCLRSYLTKDALAERFGRPLPVIGCGLSIGGAVLSKYLGEQGRAGRDPVLDAGVTVCAPNDFVSMVEHMNRGTYQKGIYQEEMCNDVRNYILRHNELKTMANVDNDWAIAQGNVHRFTRIIHFDEHIVAKSAGYRSIHHYHLDTSAIVWLPYTPIPTFALATFDDPVIGRTVMPHRWREIIASNPRVVYAEVRSGGHLGFLGTPWEELTRAPNWMEKFVLQRLDSVSAYWFDKQKSHNGGACDPWIRILSTPQGAMSEEKRLSQDSDAAQSVFSWVPNLPDIGNSNNTINNNNNNNNNNNEDAHNSNTSATNTHTNINTELRDGLASIRTIPAQRVKCNDSDQKIQANQANANTNKKKESKLDYFARYQPPPADRTNNICYFTDDTLREEPHLSLPAPLTPYFLSQRVAACDGQLGGGGGPHRRTEYRYDPVRVNCDYSIDPRRYMEAII